MSEYLRVRILFYLQKICVGKTRELLDVNFKESINGSDENFWFPQ